MKILESFTYNPNIVTKMQDKGSLQFRFKFIYIIDRSNI